LYSRDDTTGSPPARRLFCDLAQKQEKDKVSQKIFKSNLLADPNFIPQWLSLSSENCPCSSLRPASCIRERR
jgi:hypothetical protein